MMDQVPTLMDEGEKGTPTAWADFWGNLKYKILDENIYHEIETFDLSTMGTLFRINLFKVKGLLDMF